MSTWTVLSSPHLSLILRFPDPTPQGYQVTFSEQPRESGYRIHLTSTGSDEVTFEVGQYPKLPAQQAVRAFLEDVRMHIEGLAASEVEATTFAGHPASRFTIRWPGKERVVLLVERNEFLYRFVYDPRSATNCAILDNLTFMGEPAPGGPAP